MREDSEKSQDQVQLGKRAGRGTNPKYDNFLLGEEPLIGHKRAQREDEDTDVIQLNGKLLEEF